MLEILRLLRDILDRRERRRSLLLLTMVIITGFVESARVASIVPLVSVIANPSLVKTNPYLAAGYRWLGIESSNTFVLILGLAVFAIMLGSLALTAVTTWATIRFAAMRNYRLSRDLFKIYINQPYEWFLNHHSGDLGKSILSEVNQVVAGALIPFMLLITGCVTTAFLVLLLIIGDPLLAVIVTLTLGGGYFLIYAVTRKYLTRVGEERVEANRQRFRISGEAFSGIKDIKVLGLENTFTKRFELPSRRFVTHQATSDIIGQMPQFGFQALAFAIVLVIVWYELTVNQNVSQALPVIALYALAGSRLMPALQKVYQAVSKLRYAKPALEALHRDLTKPSSALKQDSVESLALKDQIEISAVSYRYPGSATQALQAVSLRIPARTMVGFVGQTGAGKTTLVDLILGLLAPESGEIRVDGQSITVTNRRSWQHAIGYVPQHIFLADDSVAGNIAFGIAPDHIDMAKVEEAARIANLDRFVSGELERGYDTLIGERGIRLSGGQRQRVGIARALYRDPDLLIMDEGTSALDNITERAVMDAVQNLARAKTIILIAHRLTTVKICDRIFLLEHGRLVASGSYDELTECNESFRAMAIGVSS
jgi:ABC-type bacteriocin/lantibiotic exporter with double-glycine peptidase domain